ncbi:MAG: cytidylate kinase family protein [Terriglobales bacterium]
MSVITISRGSFSGGKMLAECLARRLGYRCIDRDLIIQKAAAWGVSENDLREALEKPPGFLGHSSHTKYIYLAFIQAALTEEVREGKAIYHGLAGHLLLKGAPHILRTRLIAPLDVRIGMLQDLLKYNRKDAIAHIQKMDQDRKKWTQFLYGVDWGDPSLYDIVLNLEHMTIDKACDVICSMLTGGFFEFTPQCQQVMDDLALACRVRANLAQDPATSDLELEIVAHHGSVSITGEVLGLDQAKEIRRIARLVLGVTAVHLDELTLAVRF